MENLTILVVGSGAREHAISRAYEKSHHVKKIIVAPGNDFIGYDREKDVIIDKDCSLKDPSSILKIAIRHKPDLIDVAQDDALALGTVDLLEKNGFRVFGPTKEAARIEWDKKWSREFMKRHNIPMPGFRYFDSEDTAKEYVRALYDKEPDKLIYVKACGLCSGKGALKATNIDQALENIEQMKTFGGAGKIFLIEDGLVGEEFSYYAISDGKTYRIFKSAQDNKTVFNFDKGDQTGGMGAISPAIITEGMSKHIEKLLISKVIEGMISEDIRYKGILYLGGIVEDGVPMNIEYNARWGDPECQAVLPSIETDYVELISACIDGRLDKINIKQDDKTRVCVVGALRGYPKDYSGAKGKEIYGLEDALKTEGATIFGSGIDIENGRFYANGGRLLSVVGYGRNIAEARQIAYCAIAKIHIEGNNLHYRTDIGWRDIDRFLKKSQK